MRHHQVRAGATEEVVNAVKTFGAGDKDGVADLQVAVTMHACDLSDGFVARHQRVAHAGEGGHAAVPEQTLGAGADAAVLHSDFNVACAGLVQVQLLHRQ